MILKAEKDSIDIIEKKIILLKNKTTGKNLKIEKPLDFIVTREWTLMQFEDPELSKCIEWLDKKGFTKNGDKWDLIKKDDNNLYIKLPQFFMNYELSKLKVSFGRVEAKTFHFPKPNRGYCSIKEFPTYLENKCFIEMNNSRYSDYSRLSYIDFTSVDAYSDFIKLNLNNNDSLNSYYFKSLFDRLELMEKEEYNAENRKIIVNNGDSVKRFFKQEINLLEQDTDFIRIVKSKKTIKKYNL